MNSKVKLATLHKTLVVSLDEGLRLGRVHDVFVDRQAKRIAGISLNHGLLPTEDKLYVDLADILKIGRDVVIVAQHENARPLPEAMAPQSLRYLRGRKITTTDGACLGELSDLTVDRESGGLAELHLNDDRALEVDPAEISIGPDVIVIPSRYTRRIRKLEHEKAGVLERARDLAVLPESLRHRYVEIKESVNRSKGLEKVVDSLKMGSERTQQAVKRTSHKIQATIQEMRRARETDGRARPGPEEPGRDYQGLEAEHAGRTFHRAAPPPDPEAAFTCDSERTAEIDERCRPLHG